MDVGESEVPACVPERELLVVEAHAVQNSCVQIVDVDRLLNHQIANIIRTAVDVSFLDAAAGQPD